MRGGLFGLVAGMLAALACVAPARAEIRALIVAVSAYQDPIPSLEGPPNDAAALRGVLESQGARDIVTLRDADATRSKIRTALKDLGARSKPGDWVIFFYAGHGAQAKARDRTEADGLDEFLALGRFSVARPDPEHYVLDNELRGWLVNFFPRTVNVLQIADACHSGTLNRSLAGRTVFRKRSLDNPLAISLPDPPADPAAVAPVGVDPPNLVFVGAAQDNQFALEGPLPRGDSPSRGLLTFALESALKERRGDGRLAADADQDGRLSLAELAANLETRTRELSSTQQWSSATVPPSNERSVVFGPLNVPATEEPPIQVKAADEEAAEILSGRGPWASIPRGEPDLTWSARSGVVTDSRGDRVAEGLTSAEALAGVIEKKKALSSLYGLSNERRIRVAIGPKPRGKLYRKGEAVDLAVTHKGQAGFLTAFNLAGDGTVQLLYPLDEDEDGDGRVAPGEARVSLANTKAAPPFGVDHVVAVVTPEPPAALRTAIRRMDGKRQALAAAAAVRDQLDQAKGSALALGELYTGP